MLYLIHIIPPENLKDITVYILRWILKDSWVGVVYAYLYKTKIKLRASEKEWILKIALRCKHTGLLMLLNTVYDVNRCTVQSPSPFSHIIDAMWCV